MPPKKVRSCLESDVRKKKIQDRLRRLQETEEQREIRRIKGRKTRFNARKQAHNPDLFTRQLQVTMCQDLYEIIRNHKTQQGRRLCESFIRAPNRWSLPDYYDIVTYPIDLLKIQQKLKAKEYTDVRQLTSDIELMVNNAKMYYKEESVEYQNACELLKVFFDAKIMKEKEFESRKNDHQAATLRKVTAWERGKHYLEKNTKRKKPLPRWQIDSGKESEPEDAQSNKPWLLFDAVMNFSDSKKEKLSTLFWELPHPRFYPEYYKHIMNPLSLSTIRAKIKKCEYSSLAKIVADMNLVFKYAKMYNTADSKIFKSALILEKVMQNKARELMYLYLPMKAQKQNEAPLLIEPVVTSCEHQPSAVSIELPVPLKVYSKKQDQTQNKESHAHLLREYQHQFPPAGSIEGPSSETNECKPQFPARYIQESTDVNLLYACLWDNCDRQFETFCDLTNHLDMERYGHIQRTYGPKTLTGEFECLWYNCMRVKKRLKPFSSVIGIIRHVKGVHLNMYHEYQKKRKESAAIKSSHSDPTTFIIDAPPPIKDLVTQPTKDYVFQGKCKKCNFSDMQLSSETEDGCNTGIVLKCMLCPTTKVIGIEDPSMENIHSKSQVPRVVFSQVAPIEQELILPDDRSFIRSSSEPARVEMKFCVDENTREPRSVPYDTWLMVDVTESTTAPPDEFAHTQTLQSSVGQLHTKFSNSLGNNTPVPHMKPLIAIQMSGLPNYRNQLLITEKATLDNILPHTPFTGQQPITAHQVPLNAQSQQSVTINLPQAASSIKQELILSEDVTSLSLINSSSEPTRVEKTFCVNQDGSITKIKSEPTIENQLKNVPLNGQFSSAATVVTTYSDIMPMEVDLNLVKKEVDD